MTEEKTLLRPPFLVKHGYFLIALATLPGGYLGLLFMFFLEGLGGRPGSWMWVANVPPGLTFGVGLMIPTLGVLLLVFRKTSLFGLVVLEDQLSKENKGGWRLWVKYYSPQIWRSHIRRRQDLITKMEEHSEIFGPFLFRIG